MVRPEWGKKRICSSCNIKYYDFNKSPIICPSCGAEFDPEDYLRKRKGKNLATKTTSENNDELTKDITNIDDVEVETDNEVVSDDDPLLEISKEEESNIADDEIGMDEDISFIDDDITEDDEISDDNGINVDISEEDKD